MKNYSRFHSILVLCFLLSTATHAQVRVTGGPEIGFTAAGLMETHTEDLVVGLHLHGGATVHVQIGGYFAVRPSVLVQSGKLEDPYYPKQYTKLTRISIPVPLLFSKNFRNDNKLYFGAGPNLKYAVGGKSVDGMVERKLHFGSNAEDDMKPLDLNLHLRGGFDFSRGLSLGLFMNVGLTNINTQGAPYNTRSMDALGFSLAWLINENKDQ